MKYEFNSTVFTSASEMYDAIVAEWISASGMDIDEWTLSEKSDEEMADMAIQKWRLDEPKWLESSGFSRAGLIEAFAKSREPLI